MADHPLRPATDHRLGRHLPHQQANRTRAHLIARACKQRPPFSHRTYAVLARVSPGCPLLRGRFPRVTHPSATLLTPEGAFAFDLHVLGMPPAFNLSQDQTLQFIPRGRRSDLIPNSTGIFITRRCSVDIYRALPAATEHPHKLSKRIAKELLVSPLRRDRASYPNHRGRQAKIFLGIRSAAGTHTARMRGARSWAMAQSTGLAMDSRRAAESSSPRRHALGRCRVGVGSRMIE